MTSVESSKAITDATGMIPARKSVEDNYEVNSPEYVLRKQLEVSGIERPATIGYPQFSTVFNQIISEMKNSDIAGILNTKAASLESHLAEINR
ncbi:MAG: hypothetical protein HUJ60_05985 [Bacilli bacterium]|nr:hypothetical protein [Bacilli bacterium]